MRAVENRDPGLPRQAAWRLGCPAAGSVWRRSWQVRSTRSFWSAIWADPEVRRTQDGRPIVNLSVATSDTWRDKATGERKEKTEWHRVVIFSEGLGQGGRAVPEEGREGLPRGPVADAQMAPTRTGRGPTPPRSCCRASTRQLTMLDARRPGRRSSAPTKAAISAPPAPRRARASPRWRRRRHARRHGRRNSVLTGSTKSAKHHGEGHATQRAERRGIRRGRTR